MYYIIRTFREKYTVSAHSFPHLCVANNQHSHIASANYGNKKILIVDDNKLNIKVARRALADFNFDIVECISGEECLNIFQNDRNFDLILMDIMMPEMDGYQVLKAIREIETEEGISKKNQVRVID